VVNVFLEALFRNEGKIWSKMLMIMLLGPNNMLVPTDHGHSCTHGVQFWIIMVILADLPRIIKLRLIFSFGQVIFRQVQIINRIFIVKYLGFPWHVRHKIDWVNASNSSTVGGSMSIYGRPFQMEMRMKYLPWAN
jgi:hypothetical protein